MLLMLLFAAALLSTSDAALSESSFDLAVREAYAAMRAREARRHHDARQSFMDEPFLVFAQESSACSERIVVGRLANYQNKVKSIFLNVTVDNSVVVNFPENVRINEPVGPCRSYITAGNLGQSGVIIASSSSNWTATGVAVLNTFQNISDPCIGGNPCQTVMLSCGLPAGRINAGEPFPQPGCAQGDFYQTVNFVAANPTGIGSPRLSFRWVLTTLDALTISGTQTVFLENLPPLTGVSTTVPAVPTTVPVVPTTVPVVATTTVPVVATTTVPVVTTTVPVVVTTTVPVVATTTVPVVATTTVPVVPTTVVPTTRPSGCASIGQQCAVATDCCNYTPPAPAYNFNCTGNNAAAQSVGCFGSVCARCQFQEGGSCANASCCDPALQCKRVVSYCDQAVKCDVLQAPTLSANGPRTQLLCIRRDVF